MTTWTLPIFDQIVGPTELADVVINLRQWHFHNRNSNETLPPPSDDCLRALIHIAFQASLVTEEGKYSRARLFVHRGGGWHPEPRMVVEFDVQIPANEDGVLTLKRLAPIADSHDSALIMEEVSGVWHCIGLATISDPTNPDQIGRLELNQHRRAPAGISIRIDGPGLLRVTDIFNPFVLHGGRIRQAVELFFAPPIQDLLHQIDLALTQGKDIPRFLGNDARTHQLGLPIEFALSRIVAKMREARKGGALIFPSNTKTQLIDFGVLKARATGLGEALHSFYAASQASAAANSPEELRSALSQWQNAHQMILRFTEFIAGLSKVDGCVVLQSDLNVVGFGAKINAISDSNDDISTLTLINPFSKKPESDKEIMRLGTRNRSAYNLCRLLPGSTAIVVSQDGDIRVFSSDAEHLYFVDSLDASSVGLPHF